MKVKVLMWEVGVARKDTKERFEVVVPAKTNEQATKIAGKLYPWGCDEPYQWTGTGPAYGVDGKRLTIEINTEG